MQHGQAEPTQYPDATKRLPRATPQDCAGKLEQSGQLKNIILGSGTQNKKAKPRDATRPHQKAKQTALQGNTRKHTQHTQHIRPNQTQKPEPPDASMGNPDNIHAGHGAKLQPNLSNLSK